MFLLKDILCGESARTLDPASKFKKPSPTSGTYRRTAELALPKDGGTAAGRSDLLKSCQLWRAKISPHSLRTASSEPPTQPRAYTVLYSLVHLHDACLQLPLPGFDSPVLYLSYITMQFIYLHLVRCGRAVSMSTGCHP